MTNQELLRIAKNARCLVEREREDILTSFMKGQERQLSMYVEALNDEYRERREAARDAEIAAQKAVDAEAIEAAKVRTDGLHPVGTKLYEWNQTRWGGSTWKRTGLVGVVEIYTRECLGKKRRWTAEPEPGDLIIRHLKKNGEPGLKYEGLDRHSGWYPEGQEPK